MTRRELFGAVAALRLSAALEAKAKPVDVASDECGFDVGREPDQTAICVTDFRGGTIRQYIVKPGDPLAL